VQWSRPCSSGVVLGLISGYLGGWVDRILVMLADAIYAFPSLLLAIVMSIAISQGQSSAWGGILAAAISITVVFIPQYFRVIRAEVVRLKAEPFVEAAKVVGTGHRRIMGTHLLRNATRTPAAHLHSQQLRGDPDPRSAGVPGVRHRAHQRLRMGLRPEPGDDGRDQWYLVDGTVPGTRDRPHGTGGDVGRVSPSTI
jgi:hypothetical protein